MEEGYDHSNDLRKNIHGSPVKIVDYKLSLHLLGHGSMKVKEGCCYQMYASNHVNLAWVHVT
jgi:hypothetical protein